MGTEAKKAKIETHKEERKPFFEARKEEKKRRTALTKKEY